MIFFYISRRFLISLFLLVLAIGVQAAPLKVLSAHRIYPILQKMQTSCFFAFHLVYSIVGERRNYD